MSLTTGGQVSGNGPSGNAIVGVEAADRLKTTITNPDGSSLGVADGATYQAGVTRGSPEESLVASSDFNPPSWNPGSVGIPRMDKNGLAYTRQSFKDVAAAALGNILDTIGTENIRVCLPMWDTGSPTVLKDLVNPQRTWTVNGGVTFGNPGLLASSPLLDGSTGYFQQAPITAASVGNTDDTSMNSATAMLAQKLAPFTGSVGSVRLRLKKVGAPTGSIQAAIYSDSAGMPNAAVTNGTSAAVLIADLVGGTSYADYGFYFATPPNLQQNTTYWLVLSYVVGATADASDYIAWRYDSAGAYGQGVARFNGATWIATAGQSFYFDLYDDTTAWGNSDVSFIFAAKNTRSSLAHGYALLQNNFNQSAAPGAPLEVLYRAEGFVFVAATQSGVATNTATWYRNPTDWSVYAATFSYASSTGKYNFYRNGQVFSTGNGTANTALTRSAQPILIGAQNQGNSTTLGNFFQGYVGPLIITFNALSATQIGKVTNQLLTLRRYQESV